MHTSNLRNASAVVTPSMDDSDNTSDVSKRMYKLLPEFHVSNYEQRLRMLNKILEKEIFIYLSEPSGNRGETFQNFR